MVTKLKQRIKASPVVSKTEKLPTDKFMTLAPETELKITQAMKSKKIKVISKTNFVSVGSFD